jgi:hypothetical protein
MFAQDLSFDNRGEFGTIEYLKYSIINFHFRLSRIGLTRSDGRLAANQKESPGNQGSLFYSNYEYLAVRAWIRILLFSQSNDLTG